MYQFEMHARRMMKYFPRLFFVLIVLLSAIFIQPRVVAAETVEVPGGKAFLEGRRLQISEEWKSSIEPFRAASDIYSIVADYALYQMAESALHEGDTELAASSLESLLNLYPDTPVKREAQLELVNLYFYSDSPGRAVPFIEAALPGATSSTETNGLLLMLARSYAASGKTSKSDSLCWQIIHGSPSTAEALEAAGLVQNIDTAQRWLAIAKVYVLNKKAQDALDVLVKLEADPNVGELMPELPLYKAQALAILGKKDAAIELYGRIIKDYPGSSAVSTAYFERAKLEGSSGLLEEAIEDYGRLAEQFPRNPLVPQALWERAKIFEEQNDPNEYVEYEKILTGYPRYGLAASSMMYWGMKLYRSGDYEGANDVFAKLLAADLGPDSNAEASFWIAKCSISGGKTDLARVQLADAIKRFKGSYQEFRAHSMLKALSAADTTYMPQKLEQWQGLLAIERTPFASFEVADTGAAYKSIESKLSSLDPRTRNRLRFLMVNDLFEAQWELAHVSREITGVTARYALAWALFQTRAYNDSIRIALSLKGSLTDPVHDTRLNYLLYPPAYPDMVTQEGRKWDVDPMLALAVMREESHFRERIVSRSDARGLMQIIPPTGEWLAGKIYGPAAFDATMLFQPAINIEIGTYYLRYLLDKFDNNVVLAIAAYNWGPGNLSRWMNTSPPGDIDVFIESIPAEETRRYVKKVLRSYATYHGLYPPDYFEPD